MKYMATRVRLYTSKYRAWEGFLALRKAETMLAKVRLAKQRGWLEETQSSRVSQGLRGEDSGPTHGWQADIVKQVTVNTQMSPLSHIIPDGAVTFLFASLPTSPLVIQDAIPEPAVPSTMVSSLEEE